MLSQIPTVLYAGPVPLPKPTATPNDTHYPSQWALSKISAGGAWDYSKGNGIIIAVIDTGFATTHSDLQNHMLTGWNCGGTTNVGPFNNSNHGTMVAGIAAAVTNNATGIAGVGWNSSIMPLRYFRDDGQACDVGILVDRARTSGAHVINMSLTYGGPNPGICPVIENAHDAGLVVVAAAGNNNSSAPEDPAACFRVIGVGATTNTDSKASYSNFGSWLDVSAPGGSCGGTTSTDILSTTYPSGYTTGCGTSFAAPHVAGQAALLMAQGLDNCRAATTIKQTTDSINWQGGTGRINAHRSVTSHRLCSTEFSHAFHAWALHTSSVLQSTDGNWEFGTVASRNCCKFCRAVPAVSMSSYAVKATFVWSDWRSFLRRSNP
jgi:thermitase